MTERRVSASLLQRRLGIRHISAVRLVAELNRGQAAFAVQPDADLILNSRTLRLLLAICAGPSCDGDIGIAEDELQALLTADGVSTTVTIISAEGQATGPRRAFLAVHSAVASKNEIEQAIHGAKKIVVLVRAAPGTLMCRELKIIFRELRRRVEESCSISLGIHYLEPSEDDLMFVTVIFSV